MGKRISKDKWNPLKSCNSLLSQIIYLLFLNFILGVTDKINVPEFHFLEENLMNRIKEKQSVDGGKKRGSTNFHESSITVSYLCPSSKSLTSSDYLGPLGLKEDIPCRE